MFLLTSLVLYVFAIQLVHALPIVKRIVVSPHITSPASGTTWTPGNTEVVTWDTSAIPSSGDFPGQLVLGFLTADSENLDVDHPLAAGFSLRDGSVSVTCPQVTPGNSYIVVLFGDSGNRSPPFTISGPPASVDSAPSALPSNPPSSAEPVQPQQTTTAPPTSASPSPVAAANSDMSTPSSPASQTPSTPAAAPDAASPPASYATSSVSPSNGSSASPAAASSSSAGSSSSPANAKSNNAIPRTWNAGTMVACVAVTVFTIFTF